MSNNEEHKKGNDSRGLELLTIENILKTENGRKFMSNLLHYCGVSETMFDKDPVQHAYNAGKRSAGLHLERELKEASPHYYIKMIEEDIK